MTGVGNFYAQDTVVVWTGTAPGLTGTYNGVGNVRILLGSSIGKTTSLTASIANYNEKDTNPYNANVTFTLNQTGNSSVVGTLSITIDANQQWNYIGGTVADRQGDLELRDVQRAVPRLRDDLPTMDRHEGRAESELGV